MNSHQIASIAHDRRFPPRRRPFSFPLDLAPPGGLL